MNALWSVGGKIFLPPIPADISWRMAGGVFREKGHLEAAGSYFLRIIFFLSGEGDGACRLTMVKFFRAAVLPAFAA